MISLDKVKSTLEFDKVLDDIAQKCVSETGRARLRNSPVLQDKKTLNRIQQTISQMALVYNVEGGFPVWEFVDVRLLLNKIEPAESFLPVEDFLKLQNFLELIKEIRQFDKKYAQKYSYLHQLINRLHPAENLRTLLEFTFEASGKVFDNASPDLKALRREIEQIDSEIHVRMERLLRKYAEHIQEEYLTLRDGRLVVPVREFAVNKVPGIVHGQSGSGATYFVEPMSVIQLNNQMQKLRVAESKEIRKILKRVSRQVRETGAELVQNLDILSELDLLQAKARYANEFNCRAVEIKDSFVFDLRQARHPLLLRMRHQPVVPLNLKAGESFNALVISGPNAGGKTVALKTVGLLQLMFQSGFLIPVAEGSALPLCRKIFAAIGDEQSIENDLSTFSSHINTLKEIVENFETESLILIDEIGNGTEPTGGAALAIALLEKLNRPGVVTIATTHQNQIKIFAAETAGLENAAMQFDTQKLSPLFTLEIGLPGSSYTFDICRRLGLDETVVTRAIELAGHDSFKLDALLSEAQEKSRRYRNMLDKLSIKESELKSLIKLYDEKNEEFKKKKKHFEKEAKTEARSILQNVNKEIEAVIREIRETQAEKQVVKKSRERISALKEKLQDVQENTPSVNKPEVFQKGQRVRSLRYGITGHISKVFIAKSEVEIEKDGLKLQVPMSEVEIIDERGQVISAVPSEPTSAGFSAGVNISNELDLRGLTVDEAIKETERYLDAALLSSWHEVRLVHGKGTGALRLAIQHYLSGLKNIRGFRIGKWGEGDTGVTVVALKASK